MCTGWEYQREAPRKYGAIPPLLEQTPRDITDRKEAERAIQKANEELELKVIERTADLTKTNKELEQQISERHQAEIQLKGIKDLLTEAERIAFIGSVQVDLTKPGTDDIWSPGIYRILGLKPEDVKSRNFEVFLKCVHPEDRDFVSQSYRNGIATGKKIEVVYRIVWPDGKVRFINTRTEFILDDQNRPISMLGTLMDVTARREAEEQIKTREKDYRTLLSNIPGMVYRGRPDWSVSFVGPHIDTITGYSKKDFETGSIGWVDILHPDDKERVLKETSKLETDPSAFEHEYRIIRKSGEERWVRDIKRGLFDKGKFSGVDGIAFDITETKKAEQALRESEEKYSKLFRSEQDAVMIFDAKTLQFEDANPATLKMYGYTFEEFCRLTPIDISAEPETSKNVIEKISKSQEPPRILRRLHKDKKGRVFPTEIYPATFDSQGRMKIIGVVRDISERVESEEKLRKSATYLDTMGDALLVLNVNRKVIDCNVAALRLFGYSKEEMENLTFEEIFADQEHKKHYAEMKQGIATETVRTFETIIVAKNGKEVPVILSGSALKDVHGKPLGFVGVCKDITERKRVLEALRISEEKYRNLYESSRDAVMTVDPKRGFLSGNPATVKMFRCKNEKEFISQSPASLSPEAQYDGKLSSDKAQEMMATALKKGSHFFEWKHRRIDGSEFDATVLLTKTIIGGETILQATVRDVTAQKHAQQALKDSETRYKTLFQTAVEGILIADIKTRKFKYANPAICSMLGYTENELCSMAVKDLHPKKELPRIIADFESQVTGAKSSADDIPCIKKDGSIVDVDVNAAAVELDGRECLVGFFTDVTEKKKREMLEAKAEFLSMVSHDLRTPLHSIKEGISIVLEELTGKLNKEQKDILMTSKKSSERLGRLIDSALDIQKLEVSDTIFRMSVCDLNEMIKSIQAMMNAFVKSKKLALKLNLSKKRPRTLCDRDRILQVVWNLIDNAIKFTERGTVAITTEVIEKDKIIKISVKDSGIGIKKENLTKIFQKFEQLGPEKRKGTKGTGLGLAISKKIIDQHGGRIWAESIPKKGSTFSFTLPVK